MQKLDNRQLQFIGNFQTPDPKGTLLIKKQAPISLLPWIKDRFDYRDSDFKHYYNYPYSERFKHRKIQDTKTECRIDFKLDEFLEAFMNVSEKTTLLNFFKKHLLDPTDFVNEVVMKKIDSALKDYKVIHTWGGEGYFQFKGMQNINIEEMELLINSGRRATGYRAQTDYEEQKRNEWNITRPYQNSALERAVSRCKEQGDILFPYRSDLPIKVLDEFYLIQEYDLPRDHLDIVQKQP